MRTAKIARFAWSGTQLVVLSAWETGVGAVPSGDGVYGLRRALVLAGAASQVVSLWSASDASTRALMRDYYLHARGVGRDGRIEVGGVDGAVTVVTAIAGRGEEQCGCQERESVDHLGPPLE